MKALSKILLLSFGLMVLNAGMLREEARAFDDLGREETVDFCVTELGRKFGAENALKMEDHCACATDLALEKTPDHLQVPFTRLVRRQGIRPEDKEAFRAESGNLFLYLAMLNSSCPNIFNDPLLQKLLIPAK